MSDVTATLHSASAADITSGAPRDYAELLKPRVMSLVVFTALAGIVAQRLVPSEDGLGRVMVSEFLANNSAVKGCIRDHRFEQIVGLMEIGRKDGMHTFDDVLEELYLGRRISKEEAVAGARDPSRMEALLRTPIPKGK